MRNWTSPGRGSEPSAKLRISYVFMRYPMGSQPFAISDVKALAALGHRVETYALSGWDKDHAELLGTYSITPGPRSHISLHTIAAPFRPRNWPRIGRLLRFVFRYHRDWRSTVRALLLAPRIVEVAEELARTRPDVVHAFWGHFPSLMMPLLAEDLPDSVKTMFLGAYDLTSHLVPFSSPAAEVCQIVFTHAEENVPALLALGIPAGKIVVVRRGIPLDLASGAPPAREPHRICTAANLQKEKNVDLVLRTFREVTQLIPTATLSVVGDGEQRHALEALARSLGIEERVTFTGRLSRSDLFREMARSGVFLFLSTKVSERLPNVVKEAMLAECHCIVSATPGIRALIEDGRTGEIVAQMEPAALADRVAAAMRQDGSAVGREAARFVRDHFSAEASMSQYIEAWRALFMGKRGFESAASTATPASTSAITGRGTT